ncbi:prenyltransferase/squalene oxidase repeat-containing protein [Luteolibacter marinus]|uniref:prenyltransferase/squalene oxidase repeat-containing protein n=1 Tax=Luteolibacter marinus TaxID=2776705 RepID=UPI0018667D4C|nr:prenyltransferase/squalene oxidase repeat-containing protein [Luteolibacter marinus]
MDHRSPLPGICSVATAVAFFVAAGPVAAGLEKPLQAEATAAIQQALGYLAKAQNADGWWSSPDFPGLSGLAVQAFLLAPGPARDDGAAVRKGLDFIRSSAKPDGGIYNKGMANYNTSIALTTLLRADRVEDVPRIEAARKFLLGGQKSGAGKPGDDGGFGYEPEGKRSRPDLDNTVFAVEALALYRDKHRTVEKIGQPDLDWEAAIDFVSRCQNLPGSNPAEWASDDPAEKGGFTYTPEGCQDGTHSYGTMTYSGLLSLVHARVAADDPRVKAAVDWLSRRYSVDENPGLGEQGLYYYYFVMAKALTVAEIGQLDAGGRKVEWRSELARKLISLQRADGSWSNRNGRWMEQDPALATSYAVITLGSLCSD